MQLDMINAIVYYAAYYLKEVQVFGISFKDISYQAGKKVRLATYPENVVLQESHDFLDAFSKKDSNTFLPYQEYNHKISLEK